MDALANSTASSIEVDSAVDHNMIKVKNYCQRGDLTSFYSFIVQGILVTLAFLCLISESTDTSLIPGVIRVIRVIHVSFCACLAVKRFCEPPNGRRSWLVWFFDTSKQVGASGCQWVPVGASSPLN